jgi:hypothetical protein
LEAVDELKARMDIDAIKKRPSGFTFLKKKENVDV